MTIAYFSGLQDVGSKQMPVVSIGPGVPLHRLFRFQGGDWTIAPPEHRKGRADPPAGQRDDFGLLYMADSPVTAGFEYGVLRYAKDPLTGDEQFEVVEDDPNPDTDELAPPIQLVTHSTRLAIGFVDLEHPALKAMFGIDLKQPAARISHWRELSREVHQACLVMTVPTVVPIVGVTFETQQAGGNGRIFAVYDRCVEMALVQGASALLDRAALAALLTTPAA